MHVVHKGMGNITAINVHAIYILHSVLSPLQEHILSKVGRI